MGRLVYANRDTASYRTAEKRRQSDIAFITKLRELVESRDGPALAQLAEDVRKGPEWKRIAVLRAQVTVAKEGA